MRQLLCFVARAQVCHRQCIAQEDRSGSADQFFQTYFKPLTNPVIIPGSRGLRENPASANGRSLARNSARRDTEASPAGAAEPARGQDGRRMRDRLTEDERAAFETELERVRQEHRDLDAAIEALNLVGQTDQLQIQRLKKRKLILRDRLTYLEDQLTPDIIA
jgi:hypothetical protein